MAKVISHITVSALLLLTAIGMTFNVHYCQGHLYDLAVNAPAHHCCEPEAEAHACHHDQDQPAAHHCEDESVTVALTSDYMVSDLSFEFQNNHSNDLFFVTLLLDENPGSVYIVTRQIFSDKEPPPAKEVVLSQLQRFLI